MRIEIILSGRGGQGILMLGRILGKTLARYTSYYVAGSETYATEVRGGDSRVDIIISDNEDEIGYVRARNADIAVFMYPSLMKNLSRYIKRKAKVFIDTTFIDIDSLREYDWTIISEPYTQISERIFGTSRVANMMILGHLIKETKIVDPEAVERVIREEMPSKWHDINIRSFRYMIDRK
ncbi:MAG: hypothetical protein GU359_09480 [Desulfurococcales archaeon]|jgi:2-oxoglutarate ferredoxin oxidoreductase subunit gamma|nr:hypothetical protein [Desulfurococcales archaeon]